MCRLTTPVETPPERGGGRGKSRLVGRCRGGRAEILRLRAQDDTVGWMALRNEVAGNEVYCQLQAVRGKGAALNFCRALSGFLHAASLSLCKY